MNPSTRKWLALAVAIVLPFAAGFIGNVATGSSLTDWFQTLEKPSWNPPNWIFGPVWTTLYLLMGIASWLVWRAGSSRSDVRTALWVYGIHLVFNAGWSIVFFGLQSPLGGLVVILILLGLILTLLRLFFPINRWAGWLLIPYLLWVAFATVLNATIWWLN